MEFEVRDSRTCGSASQIHIYKKLGRLNSFKALACQLVRAEMPFPPNTPSPCFFYFSLTSILLIASHLGYITGTASDHTSTIIGAIIDANSRKGKEEITAMKIAVDKFNNNSKNHKLSLVFRNFTGELYRAALTGWSSLPGFLQQLSDHLLFSILILQNDTRVVITSATQTISMPLTYLLFFKIKN